MHALARQAARLAVEKKTITERDIRHALGLHAAGAQALMKELRSAGVVDSEGHAQVSAEWLSKLTSK